MAIQMRRGPAADLASSELLAGELAYTTDQKKLYIANGDGNVKQVVFVEDYANATGAANASKVDHAIAADSAAAGGALAAQLAALAPLASPVFTGNPTAPTPATSDNDTSIATTAFVKAVLSAYAVLASPAFTGVPTATTPSIGDNSTRIATTKYVNIKPMCRIYNASSQFIASGTDNIFLTFPSENFDTDGLHNTSTNPNRITISRAGVWRLEVAIDMAPATSGAVELGIIVNGAVPTGGTSRVMVPNVQTSRDNNMYYSMLYNLNSGDYAQAFVYQNSGSTLGVYRATMSAEFIGTIS